MKLLIIEDNRLLASSLSRYLSNAFVVQMAHSSKEGVQQAQTKHYDIVVLDLHLPDGSGLDVCKHLRASGIGTPILVLTASNDTPTKVDLLDAGADDFLTKPFQPAELRARLHALLRRSGSAELSRTTTLDDLSIDPVTRKVVRAGKQIELRRKEFDILEYMIRNKGRTITRQMLLDHVWENHSFTASNTVDVHVKHLRDKIDRPFESQLIETVYGLGYILRG